MATIILKLIAGLQCTEMCDLGLLHIIILYYQNLIHTLLPITELIQRTLRYLTCTNRYNSVERIAKIVLKRRNSYLTMSCIFTTIVRFTQYLESLMHVYLSYLLGKSLCRVVHLLRKVNLFSNFDSHFSTFDFHLKIVK